jgi:hypothetical protein
VEQGSWWSRKTLPLHATLLVVVPGCIALCWWQVRRAVSGNELSWAYVFEWPIFAAYAVYLWWRLVRDARAEPVTAGSDRRPPDAPLAEVDAGERATVDRDPVEDREDEELAAYNRYLAELDARGRRKHW